MHAQELLDLALVGTPLGPGKSRDVDDAGGGKYGDDDLDGERMKELNIGETVQNSIDNLSIDDGDTGLAVQNNWGVEGNSTLYASLQVRIEPKTSAMQMKTISIPERVQGRGEKSLNGVKNRALSPEEKATWRETGETQHEMEVKVLDASPVKERRESDMFPNAKKGMLAAVDASDPDSGEQETLHTYASFEGKDEAQGVRKDEKATHASPKCMNGKNPRQKARKKLSISDFELLAVLGRGAYGKVFQVKMKSTGTIYAMKVMLFSANGFDGHTCRHAHSDRPALKCRYYKRESL